MEMIRIKFFFILFLLAGIYQTHLGTANIRNFQTIQSTLGRDGDTFLGAGADLRRNLRELLAVQ